LLRNCNDSLREERQKGKIGTTKRGIGPCYADKVNRCGIRMVDLMNERLFREQLKINVREKNELLKKIYDHKGFSYKILLEKYLGYRDILRKHVIDISPMLDRAIEDKEHILFEGAQGTLPALSNAVSTPSEAVVSLIVEPVRTVRSPPVFVYTPAKSRVTAPMSVSPSTWRSFGWPRLSDVAWKRAPM